MPIRTRILAIAAVFCAGALTRADLPEIVDRVPGDARAVLVIPSVNELDAAASQLLIAMEQGEASTPKQLLRIFGLAGAIDTRRPLAVFWRAGANDTAPPMLAALVPTNNAARAMESLRAAKGDNNIWAFEAAGRTWFVRPLTDTDLIVGIEPRSLAAYQPMTGQTQAHKDSMGASGLAAAEGGGGGVQILMWGQMEEFRPMLRAWLARAADSSAQIKGMLGGAQAPGADAIANFINTLTESIARDADRFTLTARIDANGLITDFASSFKPDSLMDRAAHAERQETGEGEHAMFEALPALPFLLAMSVEASHEGVRAIAAESVGAGRTNAEQPTALHTADSIELAAYEPSGLLVMEGALSRVLIHWRAQDPKPAAEWFRSWVRSLNADNATTSYAEATGELAGVMLDRWNMALDRTAQRNSQILYGQHGSPRGVVAVREHDGYITSGPDDLINNVLKGRAAGNLAANAQIKELSAKLPTRPVAQAYFNFRPMLMQAMPMLAMMGINIDVPMRLPPIAASISMEEGQAHAGVFIPAYALKLAVQGYTAYTAMNAPPPPTPKPEPRPGVTPSRGN